MYMIIMNKDRGGNGGVLRCSAHLPTRVLWLRYCVLYVYDDTI